MEPKIGQLKVWWIPQVPMKAFEVSVSSVSVGAFLLNTLARYDQFQFENKIKPDYCNAGGLTVYVGKELDPEGSGWWDWEHNGENIDHFMPHEWAELPDNPYAQ